MLTEISKGLLKERIVQPARDGTLHQFLDTVTHKSSYLIYRSLWHPIGTQGMIAACSQIAESRKQGTIQVKYIRIVIELDFPSFSFRVIESHVTFFSMILYHILKSSAKLLKIVESNKE